MIEYRDPTQPVNAGRWLTVSDTIVDFEPVYYELDALGSVLIPSCREDVELIMWWTMWHSLIGPAGFASYVFSGWNDFRDNLKAHSWTERRPALTDLIQQKCIDQPLFTFLAEAGSWRIITQNAEFVHTFQFADAVLARINSGLTD